MRSWHLWVLALLLMLVAAVWQRRTGPSYPVRGQLAAPAGPVKYRLPRSHETGAGAPIAVPAVRPAGALFWRHYPARRPFQAVPLVPRGDSLVATLPARPPAGKVEYYLELYGAADTLRLPAGHAAVLRYHGPVPLGVLVPHILAMFLSMLIAVRAGMGVLTRRPEPRIAWEALAGFTVGGLVLGPIVQKHAFGAYWTGVPFGWDLTDNKTLVMWLAWAAACLLPLRWPRWRRPLVLTAAAVTLVVYLIPHSMRGSQLEEEADAAVPTSPAAPLP